MGNSSENGEEDLQHSSKYNTKQVYFSKLFASILILRNESLLKFALSAYYI